MFTRTEILLGEETMRCLSEARVILFGCGGVGSWCAEALVRTGIKHLTIVDRDCVDISNINRQLMATTETIGQPKVEALKNRLLVINPQAQITAVRKVYCEETCEDFLLNDFDYVIDAIDSLKDKALLILKTTESSTILFSSMGAALKSDPSKVAMAEFWNVKGCPLARALRNRFKKNKTFPKRKFQCVYSPELLENKNEATYNGSLVHITGIYGFTLAGAVINDIVSTRNTILTSRTQSSCESYS